MFDRFTDRAKRVMELARDEALKLKHEYVGSEHILAGLLREGTSVAANVLKDMDIDLDKVRRDVERFVEEGPSFALSVIWPSEWIRTFGGQDTHCT